MFSIEANLKHGKNFVVDSIWFGSYSIYFGPYAGSLCSSFFFLFFLKRKKSKRRRTHLCPLTKSNINPAFSVAPFAGAGNTKYRFPTPRFNFSHFYCCHLTLLRQILSPFIQNCNFTSAWRTYSDVASDRWLSRRKNR